MAYVNLPIEKLYARRDFNQHICLEFYRGEKWSEAIVIEAGGPRKLRLRITELERLYKYPLDKPLEAVAASFLKLHNAAHEQDISLTPIIKEIYIMATLKTENLESLDTKALIKVYNDAAAKLGQPLLKDFKSGKAKLLARIDSLKKSFASKKTPAKAPVKAPTKAPAKASAKASAKAPTKASAKAPAKGRGIGEFCIGLLKAGKTNQETLDAVLKNYPGAKTSAASIAWYRNQINQGLK